MKSYTQRRLWLPVVISVLAIFVGAVGSLGSGTAVLQDPDAPGVNAADQNPVPSAEDRGPGKIEKAGERIGERIDAWTERAASRTGSWINSRAVAGVTWLKLIFSLLLLFAVAVVERLVRMLLERHRKKDPPPIEAAGMKELMLEAVARPMSLFIWVNGAFLALMPVFVHFRNADGSNLVYVAVRKGAELGTAVAVIWFIFNLVAIVDSRLKKWAAGTESTIDDILAPLVGKTLRLFIVVIGGVIVLQNMTGVEIGPLLASLGIGGLAVALAARDSIANFFGTLTILFDKPFQVGHRVVIDGKDGVVETVGFRSTRIRMLTGHLMTIPNEKIVNSFVENIGMRPHIRWLTNITITYDTPAEKVERAVAILKEVLDRHEGMHEDFPPRVYFNGFNDWSLNILVIAWYHPPDYWAMQAWLQRTCLEILRRFEREGIEFAFPTRTVYLAGDERRRLELKILQGETLAPPDTGGDHE